MNDQSVTQDEAGNDVSVASHSTSNFMDGNDSFAEALPTAGFIAAPFSPSQQTGNGNMANNGEGSSTFQFGQVIDATNIHITSDGYVESKDQEKIENILTNCPYWKCFVPRSAATNKKTKGSEKSKKNDVKIDFANTFVNIDEDPDFQVPKRKTAGMLSAATLKNIVKTHFRTLPEDVH